MGPTLLSAPRSPALISDDFGRLPVPVLLPLALHHPCGFCGAGLGVSGGSLEPAFITRSLCRCPVPSGGWFGSCDPLLPPGGSVTAFDALSFRLLVPLRRSNASPASFPTAVKSDRLTANLCCICGSPDSDRSHPEACFPTLLRASLPDRSLRFPFQFQQFPASALSAVSPSRPVQAALLK